MQMEIDYVSPSYFRELEKQYQAEQGMGGEPGGADQARLDQLARGALWAVRVLWGIGQLPAASAR